MTSKLKSCIIALLFGGLFAHVATAQQSSEWIAKHVVVIGLDGWGAYSLEKADMPTVKQLMTGGAYTLKKRSVLPSSSAANWASMFMGAGPELHGYTKWDSKTPELPSRELSHYGMFPTVFGLLRDAYPDAEIGYEYEWDGMQYLVEQQALNFSQEIVNHATQDTTIAVACDYIRTSKPNLFALIIDEPDHTGHETGHDTPAYYAILHQLDHSIAQVIQATKDAGIYDETIFILTSDHGGINKGHGGKTMLEMETPFIISGKNVKKGLVFEESMMQFDVAATIATIFGLKQPQVWIGRPMKQVFDR
ncbi:MAG: alkaline phosphatase [Candidatus Symbiothrix sp.]|jgi:predicted AlkP superfamily pyrophosphatase or phosphodiesterase|nr:alkaline phosphatase [Candidatus Symbiothrix sp.]